MDAQHGFERERRTPVVALGVVRGNQLDQRCPRHDVFHLFEKFTLARALETEVEVQGGLFHGAQC